MNQPSDICAAIERYFAGTVNVTFEQDCEKEKYEVIYPSSRNYSWFFDLTLERTELDCQDDALHIVSVQPPEHKALCQDILDNL